jgi:hypothetical protein
MRYFLSFEYPEWPIWRSLGFFGMVTVLAFAMIFGFDESYAAIPMIIAIGLAILRWILVALVAILFLANLVFHALRAMPKLLRGSQAH